MRVDWVVAGILFCSFCLGGDIRVIGERNGVLYVVWGKGSTKVVML